MNINHIEFDTSYMDMTALSDYYQQKDDIPAKYTTEKQRFYLDRAARLAMKSTMTHKHGCVIVKDNTIIGEGYNHHITHMCHRFSCHAEVDAINKVKRARVSFNETEMYVVRIGSHKFNHCLKYSKPCCDCQRAIEKYGIKRVYYSTNAEYDDIWNKMFNK
jgi:deoxycytidylate deaminase